MKKKTYDTPQDIILESLSIKDYKDIRLPADDFLDDGSSSSFSDSENMREPNNNDGEKKKFRFGHNIYEKYSAYYICETVLNIDSQNIKYTKDINLNELTTYDRSLPYFDENLFSILYEFCKKEKNNIIFKPDYILNDISGQKLINGIENFKQNIQCLRDWIKKDNKYDIIGEVSINYLTKSHNNRKLAQTEKYIKFIQLFNEIKKAKEIKDKIKINFEKLFELIYGNEKVLLITTDGRYDDYLNNLKKSKIFANDTENDEDNNIYPIKILKQIKSSDIHFIITYVPRAYVNIKSVYSNENEMEILRKNFENLNNKVKILTEENNRLGDLSKEIKKLTEENNRLGDLSKEVKKLTEENKVLNNKVSNLNKEIENLKKK